MKHTLFIFGTRPEAIKMAPLIWAFKKQPDHFKVTVCVTGQHRQMLDQVLEFFAIVPDHDLNLMKPGQTLFDITAFGLKALQPILELEKPDIVFVQGDTTTAFIGALAAYYCQIPVAHIEAGLRSGNRYSPFPEEGNRILAGHLAHWHFAPTDGARENLAKEGITEQVHVVGNSVIDALHLGLDIIKKNGDSRYKEQFRFLNFEAKRIILITGHRRESFGAPFESMCSALLDIAEAFPDTQLVYPVHLNPNVREPVNRILNKANNIFLIEPLDYPSLLWLLEKSYLVITDSGGIQEEAPALGKPVLVTREVTERMEGVTSGTAKLVGTYRATIVNAAKELLSSKEAYKKMATACNPYGDGETASRIVALLV